MRLLSPAYAHSYAALLPPTGCEPNCQLSAEVIFQPSQKYAAHMFQSVQKWSKLGWQISVCLWGVMGNTFLL